MKRITLTIGFLLCFRLTLLAHGEEALAYGVPAITYFLILPIFISIWDYKYIIKHISSAKFSKRGLWIQSYLIGIVTYFLFLLLIDKFEISDRTGSYLFVGSLFLMQTFGKSLLYYIFNASKEVAISEILKSIYKLNIAILLASIGLGLILNWLIQ